MQSGKMPIWADARAFDICVMYTLPTCAVHKPSPFTGLSICSAKWPSPYYLFPLQFMKAYAYGGLYWYLDWSWLCLYTGQPRKKNDNDWLGRLTFCIGFVEYLVQAKLHVRLSWVSTEQIFMHLCRDVQNSVSFFRNVSLPIILSILRIEQCPDGTYYPLPPPKKSTFIVLPCLPTLPNCYSENS